jgi:hypothetical protein
MSLVLALTRQCSMSCKRIGQFQNEALEVRLSSKTGTHSPRSQSLQTTVHNRAIPAMSNTTKYVLHNLNHQMALMESQNKATALFVTLEPKL